MCNDHDIKSNFITNSLKRGWSVQQTGKTYIFSKTHNNRPKYFESNYLSVFLQKGFSNPKIHNMSERNRTTG